MVIRNIWVEECLKKKKKKILILLNLLVDSCLPAHY